MILKLVVFILMLSVLVLIHELGHFLVAKKLKVKVEEFGFGFPPRIWGKKIGETLYSINLLPIGGFVKLFGEDDAGGGKLGSVEEKALKAKGSQLKRAFFARPVWQRAVIVVAGVVMNFLLALVIVTYLFGVHGVPTPGNKVLIVDIAKDAPAAKAGIVAGDQVLSLNGKKIENPEQLISLTKENLGKLVFLEVLTAKGDRKVISLIPRTKYPAGEGAMGVAISTNVIVKRYPWYQAPVVGLQETTKDSLMIIQGLGSTVTQVATKREVPQGLAGPIGIAQLTGQFVDMGFEAVLSLAAMLSLNLAVLNILPIPALDGGRLFFILIEGITRRKVSPKIEGYAHAVGMAVLLLLIFLITLHDIFRIATGQPVLPK